MNQRYQGDGIEGTSRKSATSAKPKTKAASTVRIAGKDDDPKAKRARQRAERRKDRDEYNKRLSEQGPIKDPRYKKMRKYWYVIIGVAVAATILSVVFRDTRAISMFFLIFAYACIVAAIFVDFKMLRPYRKQQQAEAARHLSKNEQKKLEKERAERAAAEEAAAAEKKAKRRSMVPFLGKDKNAEKADEVAEAIAAEEAAAAEAVEGDEVKAASKKKSKKDAFTPKGTKAGNQAVEEEPAEEE